MRCDSSSHCRTVRSTVVTIGGKLRRRVGPSPQQPQNQQREKIVSHGRMPGIIREPLRPRGHMRHPPAMDEQEENHHAPTQCRILAGQPQSLVELRVIASCRKTPREPFTSRILIHIILSQPRNLLALPPPKWEFSNLPVLEGCSKCLAPF